MDHNSYLHENLSVCHVNCQSLFAHLDEFRLYFLSRNYHAICMSETWLRPEVHDDMVRLEGYTLLRNDRLERMGGSGDLCTKYYECNYRGVLTE